jgi:ketosteroid isomerase-like protein
VESDLTKTLQMKSLTWILTTLLLFILVQTGCDHSCRQKRMASELIELDREFARQSVEMGAHDSFLAYIHDSCVLLRPNRTPVIGRQKIEEMFSTPDTSFTLNWEPLFADISASGDLGYTYGIYTIEMDSPEGTLVKKEGTYATIWKKDQDGNWKFVLDTGNQGLGKKNGETE